jgi:hypothetical protein
MFFLSKLILKAICLGTSGVFTVCSLPVRVDGIFHFSISPTTERAGDRQKILMSELILRKLERPTDQNSESTLKTVLIGVVMVVALYLGRDVLVPIALAVLLTRYSAPGSPPPRLVFPADHCRSCRWPLRIRRYLWTGRIDGVAGQSACGRFTQMPIDPRR